MTGLFALNASYRWAVYGLAVCSLFACAVALTLPGGVGIVPGYLFLAFFALRAFNLGGGAALTNALAIGKPGFWLLCTCVWAVVGAIVFPRALAGSTLIFAIDRNAADPNQIGLLQPLHPVSGNLTQTVYCVGELVVYCSMSVFLRCRGGYRALANAILLLTALDVTAGIVDVASHAVGIDALSWLKTGDFVYFDGAELGGLVRISGTFSEASSFAGFTLQLFAFCINLWLLGFRPKLTGALTLCTGVLLLISTSGSAYVGMAGYAVVLLLSRHGQISRAANPRKIRVGVIFACLGVLGALYIMLFMPNVVKALSDFVDATILSKADSDSGVERAGLNMQALTNFMDTYGLGVGLGSVRVSSFVMVLLASLGVVGTLCYSIFLVKSTLTPIARDCSFTDRAVCYAARQGMFATLITAAIAAAMFDLGVGFYMMAAAAGGLPLQARRRARAPNMRVPAAVPAVVVPGDSPAQEQMAMRRRVLPRSGHAATRSQRI
ncbi:hypothetical protein [Paraburkholderia pallida]|uniref:hypothetical protein n=1 Tax=Paraburkholderia pallida TaxID=2547399 RepID=UPI0018D63B94|nr:hypothetical protein [Paraburkholderia pallida]